MSERVKEAIYENVVKPHLQQKFSDQTGVVSETYYDEEDLDPDKKNQNLVDVSLTDPIKGHLSTLERVPVMDSPVTGGVDGSRLRVGDTVIVSFQGGEGLYPRVIGKTYDNPANRNLKLRCEKGLYESPTTHVIQ